MWNIAGSASAALVVATSEGEKTIKAYIVEKPTAAAPDQQQQLIRAQKKLDALTIRSPINGTMQTSAITTIGQVFTAGSELMRVVPENATLEMKPIFPTRMSASSHRAGTP